jgi:hypothetical protein
MLLFLGEYRGFLWLNDDSHDTLGDNNGTLSIMDLSWAQLIEHLEMFSSSSEWVTRSVLSCFFFVGVIVVLLVWLWLEKERRVCRRREEIDCLGSSDGMR